ncbi:MAG: hypothetical protein ACXWQR_00535 [Ktedonobacterales bacterium]
MAVRHSAIQQTQLALETTPGTVVPANKVLESINFALSPKVNTKEFRPQGRLHASQVLIEKEWAELKADGIADFQALAYPLSVFGAPAVTTVFTSATQRVYTPLLTGVQTAQSFTIQKGDANGAEQVAYALFHGFNLKSDRKDVTFSADLFAQSATTGVTLTATPTVVAAQPILANQVQIYLDPTSAGIGTTLLTDTYEYDLSYSGVYGMRWPVNSANPSFAGHTILAPKGEIKIKVQADSVANGLKTAMENDTTQYIRWVATGGTVGTAGNYKLTIDAAVRVSNIGTYADDQGIYSVDYQCTVIEDPAWTANGQTMVITLVNNLPSI